MATDHTRWTDERLGDAFERVHDDISALRTETREGFAEIRQSLDRLRDVLIAAAVAAIGVLIASMVALVIAVA